MSDEDLMFMYQNGAEDAFTELYRRHSAKIFGYIKARVRKPERAHEILQEVFVKIHRSKHLYNRSFPALPWLFTVTRSVVIDEVRREKPLHLVDDETLSALADTELATTSEKQTAPNLKILPEDQQNAIHMRYIDEKTFEEIAAQLNTSPDNARQLVSRGVKKLRTLLKVGE